MGKYESGDYVKVEFADDSGPSEWIWVCVDHCDDERRLVFGVLENQPVNDYAGKITFGSEVAVNYDNIRGHKKGPEFTS